MEKENIKSKKIIPPMILPDNNKIGCDFIITKKINDIIYGRSCYDIIDKTSNNRCLKHLNVISKENFQKTDMLCKHIITQNSRGKDRKGMICNEFTFDSLNKDYCKKHINQHQDTLDVNNKITRSFKVRCYPTKEQIKKLDKFYGDVRFTYNKCIEEKANDNFNNLRNKYVTEYKEKYIFLEKTPKAIREFAIKEYVTNMNNIKKQNEKNIKKEKWKEENLINYKKKVTKEGIMRYKKKKSNQSINISKDSIKIENKKIFIYRNIFGKNPINLTRRKDKKVDEFINKGIIYNDVKIIKTLTNKYYMCFVEEKQKEMNKKEGIVAVDPGGRTFLTTYSETEVMNIGVNMNEKIGKMIKRKELLDKLRRNKKENKYKKEYYKHEEKIGNQIKDLHYKAISKLMEYSLVLIPKLNTKRIKEEKRLPKMARKIINIENHSKFIERLKEKGEEKGVEIREVTEYLSTKLCGRCLKKNEIGENKRYNCKDCKLEIDRDINGARNIYMYEIMNNLIKPYV